MSWQGVLLPAASFLAAGLGTEGLRRYAMRHGVMDQPNARSSHLRPTPRGGGLAIVVAFLAALTWLWLAGELPLRAWTALAGAGLALAAVGFADDHRPLAPGLRIAVHLLSAAWVLVLIGGGLSIDFGGPRLSQPLAVYLLAGLLLVWSLNLFNFMDGIDGIAGSQATFVAAGSALWLDGAGAGPGWVLAALALAAAAAGFLTLNWPPARIFMGDVGSGFLGFTLAALMIGGVAGYDASPWPWLVLTALFWFDATYTLIHRALRGERLTQAHRGHAYQILARRWRSHRAVTLACWAVNLLWLGPLALAAAHWRSCGPAILLLAVLPLFATAWWVGAGGPTE